MNRSFCFVVPPWIIITLISLFSLTVFGKSSLTLKESVKISHIADGNAGSMIFSLKADGNDVTVNRYKTYHYLGLESGNPVMCKLNSNEPITKIVVSPQKYRIVSNVSGNSAEFRLPGAGYYVIRINDKEKLFIFVDLPEVVPSINVVNILDTGVDNKGVKTETGTIQKAIDRIAGTGKTLVFPSGIYKTAALSIPSNVRIYLSAGAILKATDDITGFETASGLKSKYFLLVKDAQNVEISGRGTIDGNGRALRDKYGDAARMRLLLVVNSKNVSLKGVIVRDPGSWNTQILHSEDVVIRNVKMMNDVELANTDGFDPDASKRVLIENCFAYTGDDNVAVKTTNTSGYLQNVEDITVRGCVFLTKKSSLKVGTETRGAVMKNILFEDNDVVESDRGMALYCSDGALFQNVRFVNNRFEDNWPDAKQCGIHFTINKRNPDSSIGQMEEIMIKDCVFLKPFPKHSEIAGYDQSHRIRVMIDNLGISGKRCTSLDDTGIDVKGFADVTVK